MMRRSHILSVILAAAVLYTSISCTTPAEIPPEREFKPIRGSVLLDEEIFLRQSISVETMLLDITVSSQDPVQLSKQIVKNPKKTPLNISLRFDEQDIESYGSYVVRVFVYQDETLIYQSVKDIPVLTKGNPDSIEIPLRASL